MFARPSPCALAAVMAAFVVTSVEPADAGKSRSRSKDRSGVRVTTKSEARNRKVKKVKRTPKKRARRPSRRSKKRKTALVQTARHDNMPRGWDWPPTPQMEGAGDVCLAKLDELGVRWEKAGALEKVATPVTLPELELGGVRLVSTYRKPPFVMDCHLALGLAVFGRDLYDLGVREIHFSRIHDYTQVRVNGEVKNALSRHALGLAIDIRAFVDDMGRKAVVVDDYVQGDELLLSIEQAAHDSGAFRTVLTPRNDPLSHYDHFHFEIRVDYTAPMQARTPAP